MGIVYVRVVLRIMKKNIINLININNNHIGFISSIIPYENAYTYEIRIYKANNRKQVFMDELL
jgi:hypothetical protein